MSDGVYIDFSPIINAVDRISGEVRSVRSDVHSMELNFNEKLNTVKGDLESLKKSFVVMMEENRRAAALQRAITEIIRVRQELERDFGNYKVVRNTMIGILEATDLKLIRETTITSCTEELMLSTPRYWLAPVLIALAAWISDNEALANRALKEALRRDEEKTCLVFALICRRNKRTETCFKWLSRYFAKQKANDMQESIIAYINAYTNGVFGEDRDNLCEEYIEKWMDELQASNPHFERDQIDYWKNVYATYCKNTANEYPKLAECCKGDFTKINEYLMRVEATPEIIDFFTAILQTKVDRQALATAIDNELIKLVKNYDKEEAPLREEEEYLTDVKTSQGNEEWAKKRRALRKALRTDRKVDFAEQLSTAIVRPNNENVSAKKTAIRFMNKYIKTAFREFIEEKAPDFPEQITISTHAWKGTTKDGSNKNALLEDYEKNVNGRRENELAKVKDNKVITWLVLAIILGVVGVVGFICAFAIPHMMGLIVLGLVGVALGIVFIILMVKEKKRNKMRREEINSRFDGMIKSGKADITRTIAEFIEATKEAMAFNIEESCAKLLLTEGTENG